MLAVIDNSKIFSQYNPLITSTAISEEPRIQTYPRVKSKTNTGCGHD